MCLNPIIAQLCELGKIKFTTEGNLKLPCGKCSICISKRAIEWAQRAKHEIASHNESSFITLTYSEDNLPSIFTVKKQLQLFLKRLRKKIKQPIRYMVSHEYGSKTFRPHHHIILFGYNPPNQIFLKETPKGEKLFTSQEISDLWSLGFHSIGTANERSAYYIASYSLKGKKHTLTDPSTGELVEVSDSMNSSKRPAIGYTYFINNQEQIYNSKIVPRYYQKLSKEKFNLSIITSPTTSQISRLDKLKNINPTLHEHFENEKMFNLSERDPHAKLAKFTIDQQKITMESEFRETEISKESMYLKDHLKFNRDEQQRSLKNKGK